MDSHIRVVRRVHGCHAHRCSIVITVVRVRIERTLLRRCSQIVTTLGNRTVDLDVIGFTRVDLPDDD